MAFTAEELSDFAKVARDCTYTSRLPSHPTVALVTPSDSTDLPWVPRAIRAAGAGNISAIFLDGSTVTVAFAAGETRHIMATRIRNTNTTATGIEIMR